MTMENHDFFTRFNIFKCLFLHCRVSFRGTKNTNLFVHKEQNPKNKTSIHGDAKPWEMKVLFRETPRLKLYCHPGAHWNWLLVGVRFISQNMQVVFLHLKGGLFFVCTVFHFKDNQNVWLYKSNTRYHSWSIAELYQNGHVHDPGCEHCNMVDPNTLF